MHFNRKELTGAVKAAAKTIAKRNVQPILGCVKISLNKSDKWQVTSTDLDQWFAQVLSSGVATGTYGDVCIDAKQLLQVLAASTDEIALVSNACGVVTVDGMKVESYDATDYPSMPGAELDIDSPHATMPATELQRIIDQVAFAPADYDPTSILGTVCFDGNQIAGTDGSRLSVISSIDGYQATEPFKWLVYGAVLTKIVAPLLKAGVKAKTGVRLTPVSMHGRKGLAIEGSNWTLITRLNDGEYPRYQELIPQQTAKSITFSKADMVAALKKLKPFVDKRANTVTFDAVNCAARIDDHKAVVSTMRLSPALVQAADDLTVVKWKCNYNYFLEAVESMPGDTVCLQFEAHLKPLIFQAGDYRHLLMPVQCKQIVVEVNERLEAAKRAMKAS